MKKNGVSFQLTDNFLSKYKGKQPKWGPLGYFTYKRTYSRDLESGKNEEFWQTLQRVVEGCFLIQKSHCKNYHLPWNERKAQKSAQEMYRRMWDFKFLPPGRGLWAMGTDFLWEKGSAPLFNCGFVSTNNINVDFSEPFVWLMDMSMLGVGVGFDTEGADKEVFLVEPRISNGEYIIEDSREGWVEALARVLRSFSGADTIPERWNYDKIRPAGEAIKGFGGVAPGPQPLKELVEKTIKYLTVYVEEDKPVDSSCIVDLMNFAGAAVVAGGLRRTSEIAIGNEDDDEFLHLKDLKYLQNKDLSRWASNNTVKVNKYTDFEQFKDSIGLNGEPGCLWLNNAQSYSRMKDKKDNRDSRSLGVNPCLTGDTLIAVADGRGSVSIEELAKSGNDVNVYCTDGDSILIRKGRNPRITGYNKPVYRIILDNGESICCTEDHKLLVNNRGVHSQVKAVELKSGDSLVMLNKYLPDERTQSRADQYINFSFKAKTYFEHSLIFENEYGKSSDHIHHIDGNKLNNSIENLKGEKEFDHLSYHSKGLNNPNAIKISNSEVQDIGIKLCKKLGRRFSYKEWKSFAKKDNLPWLFNSSFRKELWKNFSEFSICCARLALISDKILKGTSLKQQEFYDRLLANGYKVIISDNNIYVEKICEGCKINFLVPGVRREVSYCSSKCYSKGRDYLKNRIGIRQHFEDYRNKQRQNQLLVYKDLYESLNRVPLKKEWELECKNRKIPYRMNYPGSPYFDYKELKDAFSEFNHKVVSIEFDGYKDVYNITVDDFHNLFIGGFKEKTKHGRDVVRYIGTMQCGEITLESFELCNIAETFPKNHESLEDYKQTLKYAFMYCKTVTLLSTHQPKTNQVQMRNRRIGISQSGIIENINKIGFRNHLDWCDDGYAYLKELDHIYSEWLCIPNSKKLTTVKPSGTVSLLCGATPGIHFPHSEFYIRRIRVSKNSSLWEKMKQAGYNVEPDKTQPDYTMVVDFPVHEPYFDRRKEDATIWEQLELAAQMQAYWSDNSVFVTVTIKPEEIKDFLDLYLFIVLD